ncbi:MAG: hypothetical protein M3276_10820 [Actinomycetota bacterium]|nr:hypothetical protein [Actinomycetota bacterium]
MTLNFDSASGGPQHETATATFASRVNRAEAALKGFDIGYTNGDHHLLREQVDIDITSVSGNTVTLNVDFSLRDSSGNFDDPFSGFVQVLVIADVA